MKLKNLIVSLVLLTLFASPVFVKNAFASTVTLSGTVQNSSGAAIGGATVSVNDQSSDSTTTDPSTGQYSLSIPSGTYDVTVTPPSGSSYSSAIAYNENVSSNTPLNFVLTPSGTVTLSGTVTDSQGNPLNGQIVTFGSTSSTTNSSGQYSISGAPATKSLAVSNQQSQVNPNGMNIPSQYTMTDSSYALSQDTILNITIPAVQVSTLVQNTSGTPISEVWVAAALRGSSSFSLPGNFNGTVNLSSYQNTTDVTNNSGEVVDWVLPSNSSSSYSLIAHPPTGNGYLQTTVNNAPITGTANETITLLQSVTLNGTITDPLGNPLPGQIVSLGSTSSTTNSSGQYSIAIAPGTYSLALTNQNSNVNQNNLNVPSEYTITDSSYTLNQNTTLNITLPEDQINIQLTNSLNNPVSGSWIEAVLRGNSSVTFGNNLTGTVTLSAYINNTNLTNGSGNATEWILPSNASSSYSFIAEPPSNSNYVATTTNNIPVTSNTTENLTISQKPVTLSGIITNIAGTALPGQIVTFGGSSSTTNSSGQYSISVTPQQSQLEITNTNSPNSQVGLQIPTDYSIEDNSYTLSQNTTFNITLPAAQVTAQVQNPQNNPVSGVIVNAGLVGNSPITIGSSFSGIITTSNYVNNSQTTDNNGNMILWLLPSSGSTYYNFTAQPPSGSNYNTFNLNNIPVTGNQTEVIALQYNHVTPTTTASLSPTPYTDGTYPDPVTVTLSATVAADYSIANTYYTIDNGSQTTYATPFSVTGSGSHIIKYWSVDSNGEPESPNTKTFTITEAYSLTGTVYVDSNKNGVQDPGESGYAGATVTVSQNNQTVAATTTDSNGNYTFSNLEAGNYTEELTLPDGYVATTSNPVNVPLAANTTDNFGITQPTSLATAINAGGDIEGNFAADTDYNDGSTYSTSATVDTSGVNNPAPEAVYQTVRYGNFTYTIPNLTANGTYTLQLHFSEPYWGTSQAGGGGVGSRIFNVSVNGTQELSNFDVYQAAGGANKAVTEQIPTTADSNGNITITFTSVVDNAMVSGIAVYNGTLPSPTPTPTPTPVNSLAISAGGQGTGSFEADTDYTGGSTYTTSASIDTSDVTNPAPQVVYQSVRYGNFSYTIPTYSPNTSYTVRLDFAEPYWQAAGQREFNVSINGTQVLSNFDVYQTAGGENKAVSKQFNTTSDSNGLINIQFSSVVDNAMVSGIEVSQQ